MYIGIKDVKPLKDYKILVTFENNEVKIFDINPYLKIGIFKDLEDLEVFNSVKVSFDSIEWSNGADIDPEEVYENSIAITGVAEDTASYGER